MEGGEGRSRSVALPHNNTNNVTFGSMLSHLDTKLRELDKGFHDWVSEQPFFTATTAVAANYALQGAAAGFVSGKLAQSQAANNFFRFETFGRTVSEQVCNFSVLRGTDGAMITALKIIRGKDDTANRAVAAFTSGYVFQMLVRKNFSLSAPDAIAVGLATAVCHGLLHEVQLKAASSQPPVNDALFTRTKCMLSNLGLQKYENTFKKNLLMDTTLPLLKESDLEEVGIPLGPRILIMKHIERDADVLKTRGS